MSERKIEERERERERERGGGEIVGQTDSQDKEGQGAAWQSG